MNSQNNFYKHWCKVHALPGIKTYDALVIKMVYNWHKVSHIENFEIALLIFVNLLS